MITKMTFSNFRTLLFRTFGTTLLPPSSNKFILGLTTRSRSENQPDAQITILEINFVRSQN